MNLKVRRLKRVSPVALAVAVAARESKNAELERENRWRSLLGGIDPHNTPLDHVKLLRERLQLAREMKKNAKSKEGLELGLIVGNCFGLKHETLSIHSSS